MYVGWDVQDDGFTLDVVVFVEIGDGDVPFVECAVEGVTRLAEQGIFLANGGGDLDFRNDDF
jgi:hypothetical protein